MSIARANIKLSVALALTSVASFATSASAQSPETKQNNINKRIAAALASQPANPEGKVVAAEPSSSEKKVAVEDPKPDDLKKEINAVKAENAEVRELLRKMEEQQKILLEQVDRLQ